MGVSLLSVGAACAGGDDGDDADPSEPSAAAWAGPRDTDSEPFLVEAVPDGYALTTAGRGSSPQAWGMDCCGSDEPVTLLAPPGDEPDGDRAVAVAVTAAGDDTDAGDDVVEVGGRSASYRRAEGPGRPAQLVVPFDDDHAVRLESVGASPDELAAIAAQARPDRDRMLAPAVGPVDGFEVIGALDAHIPMLQAQFLRDGLRASDRAHVARWARPAGAGEGDGDGDPPGITVATVPNGPLGYDGVAAVLRATMDDAEDVTVDGRAGLTGLPEPCFAAACRSLVTTTDRGDVLWVDATGDVPPPAADLVAVAASTRTATAGEWDAFTRGATPPGG